MLSDEQIKQFQDLYKNHFGKEIGREEAIQKGNQLINIVKLTYKPMTEKEYQQFNTNF
jgi:hypothetical protein